MGSINARNSVHEVSRPMLARSQPSRDDRPCFAPVTTGGVIFFIVFPYLIKPFTRQHAKQAAHAARDFFSVSLMIIP